MVESDKKVDIGIITIREDEFTAVLRQFDDDLGQVSLRRLYNMRRVATLSGDAYRVAVVRCIEQGNGEAQAAARDLLDDLDPQWVLVVGIAGGAPSSEFTLGDVVVPMRICDFSVEAALKDRSREYALAGGPLERDVTKLIANLPAMDKALGGWASPEAIGMDRPSVNLSPDRFYGDKKWKAKVEGALRRHFGDGRTRSPRVLSGAVASSDRLIKDEELLKVFLRIARQVIAVEMESAGIYRATQPSRVPFLAIRGISDVVGFERNPDWTEYACRSAASFTRSFLWTRPIEPRGRPATAVAMPAPAPPPRPSRELTPPASNGPGQWFAVTNRTPEDRLARMLARGVIRCGCIKHPPLCDFEWRAGQVEACGLYVDMCRAVCEKNGLDVAFVAVEWSELPRAFHEPLDLDFVLSIFETRQRLQFADFTASFHSVGVSGVILKANEKVASVEDLSNEAVRIVVTKGEVGWEYVAHELQVPKRRLIIIENADLTEMVDYVLSGRADIAICDDVSCHKIAKTGPPLWHVFRQQPLYLCKNSIMLPKGEERLAEWILAEFRSARSHPTTREVEQGILADFQGMIRRFT